MYRPISLLPVLVLTAVALSLAGCAGGDAASSQGTTSKAEFVKRADAICKQMHQVMLKKLRIFVRSHPGIEHVQPEIEKDRLILALTSPLVKQEVERLESLPTPEGDGKRVKAFLAALEAGIRQAETDRESTVTGTYREASKLASDYGLRDCYPVVL